MSLAILVTHERWQDFDTAWQEAIDSGAPVEDLLVALRLAGDKKRISRCSQKAREHALKLEADDRFADAAHVLGAVLVAGANPSEVQTPLWRCAVKAWGEEPWWPGYCELIGLQEGAPDLRAPWKAFSKLASFTVGSHVFHPGGWGVGEVLEVKPSELEIVVRFHNGRQDNFPMNAMIDIFDPLRPSDIRAQFYVDAEGLRKHAKKEPLDVLKRILERHNGQASSVVIRNAMLQIGIEGSAWSAWWRKARKLAENSEWFEVTGSAQKATVRLLLAAKDPVTTLKKQLHQAGSLADVHTRVRDLFIGDNVEERVREAGLELLAEAAESEDEPVTERLAAWLFLRDQTKETPPAALAVLAAARLAEVPTDPSIPPALWALFQELPSAKDQERTVDLMRELFGDEFLDEVARHLPHAASGAVRAFVDALREGKRRDALLDHYLGLLARPLRAPTLLVTLARLFEDSKLEAENLPTPMQRAQALLSLANSLFKQRRGNPHLTRVHQRLVDLLSKGDAPLLRMLLKGADVSAMHSLQMLVGRGVDDAIDHLVTDMALELDRHFFSASQGPFWSGTTIWTTRQGLEKRSAELRHLREVKIPENQDAIGRAASYGDLSENAEWEAAIEEQRNLTSRASAIEAELREADLIENAAMPEATVCPGTEVRYREKGSGEEREIVILGPWDEEEFGGHQVVSYRAPLAAGLLGLHEGDSVTIQLPESELPVEVLEVRSADLDG